MVATAMASRQHNPPARPFPELVRHRSFEEVAYFLWHGELPTPEQLAAQNRAERDRRTTGPAVAAVIADQPVTADPLDTLRTAVQLLGADDTDQGGLTPAWARAQGLRLFAALPSVIAQIQRRRHGLGAVAPREHLGYAANFLCMTLGRVPEPQVVAAFETSLVLYAEHGSVGPSGGVTGDVYSAVAGLIDDVKASRQASAGGAVVRMVNEIAIPDNARPWLEDSLADGREIPGFGCAAHEDGDPGATLMRTALGVVAALRGRQDLLEVHDTLAAAVHRATGLRPNLHYPAGPAYRLIGFDAVSFGPVLVSACLPGWIGRLAGDNNSR